MISHNEKGNALDLIKSSAAFNRVFRDRLHGIAHNSDVIIDTQLQSTIDYINSDITIEEKVNSFTLLLNMYMSKFISNFDIYLYLIRNISLDSIRGIFIYLKRISNEITINKDVYRIAKSLV